MGVFVVEGRKKLEGEISVRGAKNAVLPVLAATLISGGENVIHNCPAIRDVETTVDILEHIGCKVVSEGHTITVNSDNIENVCIPDDMMRRMRSSIIFLGAMIGRTGTARVSMPGGCAIGTRPVDMHIKALRQLGADIKEEGGYINCIAAGLKGTDIHLDFPSVGATENIMLAAARAEGTTIITNAAREPEISDLADFINKCGGHTDGAGTDCIVIEGTENMHPCEHTVIPDRIAAATYLIFAAAGHGSAVIDNVIPGHMKAVLSIFEEMGLKIRTENNRIILYPSGNPKASQLIRTMPYPGFPTDVQTPLMALAAMAEGTGVFVETIFENRFTQVDDLRR
ncbi:MAG: UDP-N-acetylglucosamine 1-carboxyvinyltransferase, partial [Oscillospiraceae bacterium]|nr:UDP-N-acetylglucosamine 1-carboxyvinyltransferase [Oscillospiraceae bacterium]